MPRAQVVHPPWVQLPWVQLPWVQLPWVQLPWVQLPWVRVQAAVSLSPSASVQVPSAQG